VLTRPEDDSEFKFESDAEDGDDDFPGIMGSGDELGVEDMLITVLANYEGDMDTILINSPVPCKILELNGEVEDNPDLVNDDAYGDGWCMIVKPHDFDEDQFLDEKEYIEMLNELP
jgi:glycine cleavage system H protein